jgi:hypothetical protein
LAISEERSIEILSLIGEHDEKHYHDVLIVMFTLGGKTLREGIRDKVREFYAVHVVKKPYLVQERNTEFYLSP